MEGSDSPRDYLERCLECIDSREPQVKAWVVLNLENARQAADESGKRYRQGHPLSVIDGMPLGIKDVPKLYPRGSGPRVLLSLIFEKRG